MGVLGIEKAPISLATFQEMKYNNSEKYEQLKDKVYIQQKFNSEEWLDKINLEKQAKHIELTRIEGKSHFFDDVDVLNLYDEYKMTGQIRNREKERSGNETIDIVVEKKMGIDIYSGNYINGFTIKYSKTGSHIIPTYHEVVENEVIEI